MAKTKKSKLKKTQQLIPSNKEDYTQHSVEALHECLLKKASKPRKKLSNSLTVADLENISRIVTKSKRKIKLKKESKSLKLLKKRFTSKNGNFNYKKFIHSFLYPTELQYVSESDEIETLDDFLAFTEDSPVDNKKMKVSKPTQIFVNTDRQKLQYLEEEEEQEDIIEEMPHDEQEVVQTKKPSKLFKVNEFPNLNHKNENLKVVKNKIPHLSNSSENTEVQVESITTTAPPENEFPSETMQTEPPSNITGMYELYPIKEGSLIILEESSHISFNGIMELTVFYGTVQILGKKLDKNSPPTKLYSMRGSAFLTITNMNVPDNSKEHLINKVNQLGFAYTASSQLVNNKLKENTVLLYCKSLNTKMVNFIKENSAQRLYPESKGITFSFRNTEDPEWNIFKTNEGWDVLADDFTANCKVMLCGGKSVGKSTLMRFLINRLLEKFKEVAVIDLDPGQPEFTMPGCISATIVTDPVIGPNYTHLKEPEQCLFIPNIYINSNHDIYLACAQELLKTATFPNIPTIVNFMGFTNGFGVHLVSSVISAVVPTRVVQIESGYNAKNYSVDLTPDVVCNYRELLSPEDVSKIDYDLFKLTSMNNNTDNWELEPRLIREFSVFAYFSQMLPAGCEYLTEKEVKIYRCRLSDIKIIHNGKECDPMVANASLVALCTKHESNNDIFKCHGYGIVRGLSIELNYLALLTPVSEEVLDVVDHLVLGSVTLPPSIYLRQSEKINGLIPYTMQGELSYFSKAPKKAIAFRK